MKHLKKKTLKRETKIHICNVAATIRTIFLVLFGLFCGIGICLLDSESLKLTAINFVIAFICLGISIMFDNLLFETAYKGNEKSSFK